MLGLLFGWWSIGFACSLIAIKGMKKKSPFTYRHIVLAAMFGVCGPLVIPAALEATLIGTGHFLRWVLNRPELDQPVFKNNDSNKSID